MIGNFLRIQELCKTPIISESAQEELKARGFLEVPNGRYIFQQLQEVQSNYADSARDVAEVALRVFVPIAAIAGCLAAGFGVGLDLPWLAVAGVFSAFICGGMNEGLSAKPMREVKPLPSRETVSELMKKMKEHLDATYRYIQDHGESMERLTDGTVREEIRSLRKYFASHPRTQAEIEELLFVPESRKYAVETSAEPNAPLSPGVELRRQVLHMEVPKGEADSLKSKKICKFDFKEILKKYGERLKEFEIHIDIDWKVVGNALMIIGFAAVLLTLAYPPLLLGVMGLSMNTALAIGLSAPLGGAVVGVLGYKLSSCRTWIWWRPFS